MKSLGKTEKLEFVPGIRMEGGILELWQKENLAALSEECSPPPALDVLGNKHERLSWLRARSPISTTNLPRYIEAIYNNRDDLRESFPEVAFGELVNFREWLRDWGRYESDSIRLLGFELPSSKMPRESALLTGGVDVVGFLNAEHGIGQAARLIIASLNSAGVRTSNISYRNTASRQNVEFPLHQTGVFDTVITAVNAELNEPLRKSFGVDFFHDRYVIGQWFWELESPPEWYRYNYKYVNELWAPTRFIEKMLKKNVPKEVTVTYMPLPLRVPEILAGGEKSQFGLPNKFMFLFTFDFMSVAKRKNPLGLIGAFKAAFAEDEGPILVLKSVNSRHRPRDAQELRDAVDSRNDIFWFDEYFDADKTARLMSLSDCYISLHRSEGLGLTIAEAMLLEKPVIATAYSGNLDFMTSETSYGVPWKKVRVGRGADAYSKNAVWTEPDYRVAAELMRYVYENPERAKVTGKAARTDLQRRFTLEMTGARMRARLEEIWTTRRDV